MIRITYNTRLDAIWIIKLAMQNGAYRAEQVAEDAAVLIWLSEGSPSVTVRPGQTLSIDRWKPVGERFSSE